MTIERNQPWGRAAPLPSDGVLVRTDAEARSTVEQARRAGTPMPTLGLLGGDLARTLGGRGDLDRLHGPEATTVPIDLGSVLLDGRQHWFVAHLVARTRWWRGRVVAVMNAQWIGRWDVAPRSHPNDGRLDLLDARLGCDDKFEARRRLRTGTHVPHPGIEHRQVQAVQLEFERPVSVWLDGTRVADATQLSIRVEADALRCVV